jgi:hypothetical protein
MFAISVTKLIEQRPPPQTLQQQHQQKLEEQKSIIGKIKRWLRGTKVHKVIGETFNLYTLNGIGY